MRLQPEYTIGPRHGNPLLDAHPLDLDELLPATPDASGWEVEIGYGKGRYLLRQALAHPRRRYLGIEVVSKYAKLLSRRAHKQGAENLLNLRGEALFLLATVLPRGFADVLHVYFPDPWPKVKHRRRRLFDPGSVDLVLGVLRPGGTLCFATDFLEYGELVHDLLGGHPDLDVEPVLRPWPDGARTNYEAKYIDEGRPILRLQASLRPGVERVGPHPRGVDDIVCAWAADGDDDTAPAS
ncbi:MAG: hypothetical protein AAGC60_14890 [Acidobacteriota bacterium]